MTDENSSKSLGSKFEEKFLCAYVNNFHMNTIIKRFLNTFHQPEFYNSQEKLNLLQYFDGMEATD